MMLEEVSVRRRDVIVAVKVLRWSSSCGLIVSSASSDTPS